MIFVFQILLILLFPSVASANGLVTEIHDSEEVVADIYDASEIQLNRKVIFISRKSNKAIAFGVVKKIDLKVSPHPALIEIEEIIDHSLIMPKDLIYPLNYEMLKDKKVPGFTSLSLHGDNDIPSQFKELASFGVFTSDGHTLDAQEFLISPFQIQYGIINDFGVKMVNALWLDGYANAGIKYRAMRNKYARVTVNTFGAYKIQSQDYIWQAGGVVTLPSNAKFQSHLMMNITLDPQFSEAHATKGFALFQDSDIRSITEYITNDWNRVLYGFAYNVDLQAFGGTVSYMWIWDSFHTSLGIATRDFSNLTVGRDAYYYVYDIFWRF